MKAHRTSSLEFQVHFLSCVWVTDEKYVNSPRGARKGNEDPSETRCDTIAAAAVQTRTDTCWGPQ